MRRAVSWALLLVLVQAAQETRPMHALLAKEDAAFEELQVLVERHGLAEIAELLQKVRGIAELGGYVARKMEEEIGELRKQVSGLESELALTRETLLLCSDEARWPCPSINGL